MTTPILLALSAVQFRQLDRCKSMREALEGDSRLVNGLILPHVSPKFSIPTGGILFTMGPCFPREIKQEMTGVSLPAT
ncbi:MAG: hypothetical protein ACJAWC_002428 [Yoonia sp.]|jgi:hypothetical protein